MEAEAIMQMLRAVQARGTSTMTTETLDDYDLGGVDCPICGNTGSIVSTRDGALYVRECDCMAKRRSLRRVRHSGIEHLLARCTFEGYQIPDEARERIRRRAEAFCEESSGWFYIAGKSGSGKTHICTAICGKLIEKGEDVYYMPWRDESTALKAAVTDAESYECRTRKLKTVPILYIDDFLKGGTSDADIRLAFEILNGRYINPKLRTIISSELDVRSVLDRDEALGSRIYERSRGYVLQAPNENWRFR